MRIELNLSTEHDLLPSTPTHHTWLSLGIGWNSGGCEGFPAVIEVSNEEGEKILGLFREWQQIQSRLKQFPHAYREFRECQCGDCPQ